jgi:beta-glucanase (GH16 family)
MRLDRIRCALAIPFAAVMAFTSAAFAQTRPGWDLIWADEFNGPNIDNTKWSISNGASNVNQELEYYSNSANNVFIQNGCLVLRAIKENVGGRNYTSGKMTSAGKGDWLYGRFEVRAKLNNGQGMWPAIWMMPTDNAYGGWPASGEIDIMELLGNQPNKIYSTLHWATNGANTQSQGTYTFKTGTFADTFHVFAFEWEAGKQRMYVDDSLFYTGTHGAPFDKRFYFILNVAVGGSWPGNPDASTVFPNDMVVDYARVYQKSTSTREPAARTSLESEIVPFVLQNGQVLMKNGGQGEVTLLDLTGRAIQRQQLFAGQGCSIRKDLPDGMYLLKVISESRTYCKKLMKSQMTLPDCFRGGKE